MFNRVLVPLDGSSTSELSLPVAAQILSNSKTATLTLLTVLEADAYTRPIGSQYQRLKASRAVEQARRNANQYFAQVCCDQNLLGPRIDTKVVAGDPASAIRLQAQADNKDLIILTKHNKTGLRKYFSGSVTRQLLHEHPTPIYVVREKTDLKRILVPLDISKVTQPALPKALALAEITNAEVTLLHVAPTLGSGQKQALRQLEETDTAFAERLGQQRWSNYLEEIRAQYNTSVPINIRRETGQSTALIANVAAKKEFDLVAMGTQVSNKLSQWLYGDLNNQVLRAAQQSMFVSPTLA